MERNLGNLRLTERLRERKLQCIRRWDNRLITSQALNESFVMEKKLVKQDVDFGFRCRTLKMSRVSVMTTFNKS